MCGFAPERGSVVAVCNNAEYYKYYFNDLGPCPDQTVYLRLLKPDDDAIFRPERPAAPEDGEDGEGGEGGEGGGEQTMGGDL